MTDQVERMLPLYEAKMIHHYDHRWATYEPDGKVRDVTLEEKQDPSFVALSRYWVREEVVADRLEDRWSEDWLLGWRDICRSTDERTAIATIVGEGASPEGGTLLAFPSPPSIAPLLLAIWNSFVFDFVARQKVGGTHLKYFSMRQLPVPVPSVFMEQVPWAPGVCWHDWLLERVHALLVDSDDMQKLSGVLPGKPIAEPWNPSVRLALRAELDAALFHLFGVSRDDVDYIMETFPIVKRKDMAAFGTYRTKELILEIYDEMQRAIVSETSYVSPADRHLRNGG